jgi:hypothetical protein
MVQGIAESISPARLYRQDKVTMTDIEHRHIVSRPTERENIVLSRMAPLERWKYLARKDVPEFIVSIIGVVGGIYMIVRAIGNLWPHIYSLFGLDAFAQSMPTSSVVPGSTRDSFDWYVALLMGITLIGSQALVVFASTESKVSHGKDMVKLIIGFTIGFLSGKR